MEREQIMVLLLNLVGKFLMYITGGVHRMEKGCTGNGGF